MCGKNFLKQGKLEQNSGSPPRVREKLERCNVMLTNRRITPACAGKTASSSVRRIVSRDHPRVCGKNMANFEISFRILGSPPRVREKRGLAMLISETTGITPACAGKTMVEVCQTG